MGIWALAFQPGDLWGAALKRMDAPNPLTGSSLVTQWMNRLRAFCVANRITKVIGGRVKRSTHGTILEIDSTAAGGGGTAGMNYRGTYLPGNSYAVNDVVRVRTGAYPLGIWICVKSNPIDPVTLINVPPQYPEPFDSSGGATANTWELIALGVKLYTGCKGGVTKQVYIQLMEV